MALHGRRARLLLEYEKLINLEKRSDFIRIEPLGKVEGMPPEDYRITFTCLGVAGLNADNSPQLAAFHQVSMKLSANFPNQEPYLKWLTPIWHPNIEHKEPHHVCTNNVQNWYATKSLDDLVVALGEMVQYRRYHAAWTAPFPLDKEAADWVINFAEPNGFVSQEKPFDNRQIVRPKKEKLHGALPYAKPKPSGKLVWNKKTTADLIPPVSAEFTPTDKVTVEVPQFTAEEISIEIPLINQVSAEHKPIEAAANIAENPVPKTEDPVRRAGITLGLRMKEVMCHRCYENFKVPNAFPTGEMVFVCDKCRNFVSSPA